MLNEYYVTVHAGRHRWRGYFRGSNKARVMQTLVKRALRCGANEADLRVTIE